MYNLSKGTVKKLSIGLATDFAHCNIPVRINVLHLGVFPSEMVLLGALKSLNAALPGLVAPTLAKRAGTSVVSLLIR